MTFLISLLFVLMAMPHCVLAQQLCPSPQDPVSQRASDYLRELHLPETETTEPVSRSSVLTTFYRPCNFTLAWTTNGNATSAARTVIDELRNSDSKGLNPQDYGWPRWGSRACALTIPCEITPVGLAKFDLDLTVALMRYLLDLNAGRVNPRVLKADFDSHRDLDSIARFMWSEIVPNRDVHAAIQKLEPPADGYKRVEDAFQHYREIMNTTADVVLPQFQRTVAPGDAYDASPLLISRLKQLDDIATGAAIAPNLTIYQGTVVDGIRHFQTRHGLTPSGILDAETYRQLSVPIQQRALQLSLTLERWRWVQHSFDQAPIVVNIPEYRLRTYDDRLHVTLSMRVIVGGASHRKTPILQGNVTTVILRPYWNVPASIARNEIIPKVMRDPHYLTRNGYEVVSTHGGGIAGKGTNLISGIRNGEFRVRQLPGEQNALGRVKFVFPNPYNVYIHGTPLISLFQKSQRDLSHGRIRVEDPVALSVWVLRSQKGWSRDKVEESMAGTSTINVPLSISIPVLIVYGTAIVNENSEVHFFKDIYGHDVTLLRALGHVSDLRATADREPM